MRESGEGLLRDGTSQWVGCDRPLVEFVAGKRSVQFRFQEAAAHHRVLTTHTGSSQFRKADGQDGLGSTDRGADWDVDSNLTNAFFIASNVSSGWGIIIEQNQAMSCMYGLGS